MQIPVVGLARKTSIFDLEGQQRQADVSAHPRWRCTSVEETQNVVRTIPRYVFSVYCPERKNNASHWITQKAVAFSTIKYLLTRRCRWWRFPGVPEQSFVPQMHRRHTKWTNSQLEANISSFFLSLSLFVFFFFYVFVCWFEEPCFSLPQSVFFRNLSWW